MACHCAFLALMARWAACRAGAGYFAGLAAAGVLVMDQYRMIRERDRQRCFLPLFGQ